MMDVKTALQSYEGNVDNLTELKQIMQQTATTKVTNDGHLPGYPSVLSLDKILFVHFIDTVLANEPGISFHILVQPKAKAYIRTFIKDSVLTFDFSLDVNGPTSNDYIQYLDDIIEQQRFARASEIQLTRGQFIEHHMKRKRLRTTDVVERTGLSRMTIHRLKSGDSVDIDSLSKLSDVLGVEYTTLLDLHTE